MSRQFIVEIDIEEIRKDVQEWADDFHRAGGWENAPRIQVDAETYDALVRAIEDADGSGELPKLAVQIKPDH